MVCPTPLVGEKSFSEEKECIGRRQLLSYLVANPTLTIAARWGLDEPLPAEVNAIPPLPGPTLPDFYDLGDALKAVADPPPEMLVLKVKKPADVAIMAETFGQALDGQEAIKASYNKWEAP